MTRLGDSAASDRGARLTRADAVASRELILGAFVLAVA